MAQEGCSFLTIGAFPKIGWFIVHAVVKMWRKTPLR
jgi:hypothetical protein